MMPITIGQSQKRRILILIDSSTKATKESKRGPSTVCWAAYLGRLEGAPLRVGLLCLNYDEGPNRAFYIGVIRALEDCFIIGDKDCVFEIKGDCKCVIDQLTASMNVDKLDVFYRQVKKLEGKYKESNRGQIQYKYISEKNDLYKKIDRCAKEVRNFVEQRLGG
jgi:ribonuclease HI